MVLCRMKQIPNFVLITNYFLEDRGPREFKPRGDGEYRRHDDKKAGAAGDFNPQFRGGVGRGAPAS